MSRGPLAVYDGPTLDGKGHVVYLVGVGDFGSPACQPDCSFAATETAKVLASVEAAGRSRPPAFTGSLTDPTVRLPFVNTSKTRVYYLDGDSKLQAMTPDGRVATVGSLPGTASVHVVFAVSPDDAMLAVAAIDYTAPPVRESVYVSHLNGSGKVAVFESSGPDLYWPVGWHDASVVLAYGPVLMSGAVPPLNQYGARGYALLSPVAGSQPRAVGPGDCVPTGALTPAGTACVTAPGLPCLGKAVGSSNASTYYSSCLRRVGWDGKETVFLVTGGTATPDVTVNHAALSSDGKVIITDRLFWVLEPAAGGYPGFQGGFSGLSAPVNTMPGDPGMGWVDPHHASMLFFNTQSGATYQRIYALDGGYGSFKNVYFEGAPASPFVPTSPVIGGFVGTLPGGL